MLDRLEVYNFKSYRGRQTIGPFHGFSAVIGPNGAGKSNLMDAISFVLGVRSASLRSTALKDLVYRSGKTRKHDKGKGKATEGQEAEDESQDDEDDTEQGDATEEENEEDDGVDGERTAWVMAVYIDRTEQKEWRFQRSISTSGTSEYRLNGKPVTHKKYDEQLQRFNILVKAKNFLVFQGDVEQVASQSPKDLAKLIDQISGSLDLKEEYDRCAAALQKATETSVAQHSRRKGVNNEVKQFKLMSTEAKKYRSLQRDLENATSHQIVWKLWHLEQGMTTNEQTIEERNAALDALRKNSGQAEEKRKDRLKEVQKKQKEVGKRERTMKAKEKELEEARPEISRIDGAIEHATKKLKRASDQASKASVDVAEYDKKIEALEKDKALAEKAKERHRREQEKLKQEKGISLGAKELEEYNRLKGEASARAPSEREQLKSLVDEDKTKRDAQSSAQDQLDSSQNKIERLEHEELNLEERKEKLENKMHSLEIDMRKGKSELDELRKRKTQISQTEAEYNEKLADTLTKLQEAGAEKREKDSEIKFKETLATLRRTFPGVRGRVIDLCKPSQQKYGIAVQTVIGRNVDSIVCDSEKTAIACIEYMRVQRLGTATFLPLDTIQVKPISDKYRNFAKGARLAIDVITFDIANERAMQMACGDALICDDMRIARYICYDKGQKVKTVTLEGTVIHKAGTITGGVSRSSSRHFEDQEVEGLRRREAELRSKLGELFKNRPKPNAEEQLVSDIARIEADLLIVRDDYGSTELRLKGIKDELKVLRTRIKDTSKTLATLEKDLASIDDQAETIRQVIHTSEDAIFADFCARIGVDDIREYEEKQLRSAQEDHAQMLKYETQLARLETQISFNRDQLTTIRERHDVLEKTASSQRSALERLDQENVAKQAEIEELEREVEELKEAWEESKKSWDEANQELDQVKKDGSKALKALDKALKEIATCNDEIERLASERFAIYRRCKMDEIDLPLVKGSLDDIPIEEAAAPAAPMDVDGPEDETQNIYEANDYGVEVDFDEIDEDERADGSDDMAASLNETVVQLQSEIEKMSVNLKAIERLGDSEQRFKDIDSEFDAARDQAKKAKDAFNIVKKKRCDLFNKAFRHIEDRIASVYRDLTKGRASPQGGIAYLSLEEPEEPYLHGIKYHAMPPLKRFRDMDQLSGGEKTMAALALLFAIHSFHPSPFFVLDEVDGALDNTNVQRVARYVQSRTEQGDFQCIVITHKLLMYEASNALVGIYREGGSKTLTLDLTQYAD
ncbi:cohesin subunit SMC1 [Sporobolomyces koalae]|uniref:cohesin subunit SMC1 n=1 Tax=Sporobolomyces koalae TaxID=500713 RepID=UPI00318165DA